MLVHYNGYAGNLDEYYSFAKKNNLRVIEDAAHALGAKYEDGTMVGNCKYSDMTGFSFHPVKSIAAGEGGMITTNNKRLYKKLLKLRSHGINKLDDKLINKELAFTDDIKNPWYYEMQELGYNYRITDFQCALGISQLKKLSKFVLKKQRIAKIYNESFNKFNFIKIPSISNDIEHSYHLYVILIDFKKLRISKGLFFKN